MRPEIRQIITENERRLSEFLAPADPITGKGCQDQRVRAEIAIDGDTMQELWLPRQMAEMPLVRRIMQAKRITDTAERERFERARMLHDFTYWAARYVKIKQKGEGAEGPFVLNRPQRIFLDRLESQRLAGKPIRFVLLKARQWGGSTLSQIYMAWLQLVHRKRLNSLIIAHQGVASDVILSMYRRVISAYPARMLHDNPDEGAGDNERKFEGAGKSRNTWRVPQRDCTITIGTAESPDSSRGGDYNLVHLSEVGIWKATAGKKPEDIVRAACAGVLYKPMTMIVYESTANGIGNFFHREYLDARDDPHSQFRSIFIAWHDIEQNMLPFGSEAERCRFAEALFDARNSDSPKSRRRESGKYMWWLWQKGVTLEGLHWYETERAKHTDHASMAAECPSDDTEAFVNSGMPVFDKYRVEALRPGCAPPAYTGEVTSASAAPVCRPDGRFNRDTLRDVRFVPDTEGDLWIWQMPAPASGPQWANRYLTVVDIGGRSAKSDWSVIAVFDRLPLLDGRGPELVAQWYGHIDMDVLAWKAAQVSALYHRALLVIESNTLETHDPNRCVDGDQSLYILNQLNGAYDNLYARPQTADEIRDCAPRKYGFHTNTRTKPMIISTLRNAVREGLYTERDERCLNEMLTYERKQNGAFGAIIGAHDDLVMTRAIALHISASEMEAPALRQGPARDTRNSLWL